MFRVGDDEYELNPVLSLPEEYRDVVALWRLWRSGGMGAGFLPDAGGAADQACWLLDAFGVMETQAALLERKGG